MASLEDRPAIIVLTTKLLSCKYSEQVDQKWPLLTLCDPGYGHVWGTPQARISGSASAAPDGGLR
jgi:hypothetical protein